MLELHFVQWFKAHNIVKRILNVLVVTSAIILFFTLLINTGLISKDVQCLSIPSIVYLIIILGYIFKPQIYHTFKKEFIKSQSIKVLVVPLVMAPFIKIIVLLAYNIFNNLSESTETINTKHGWVTLSYAIYYCLAPAVVEEILFRFVGFNGLRVFVENLISKTVINDKYGGENIIRFICTNIIDSTNKLLTFIHNKLFIKRDIIAMFVWIMLTSYLFAQGHTGYFFIHFVAGVLFAILYLKYGLLSSIIAHFLGNYSCAYFPYIWNLLF